MGQIEGSVGWFRGKVMVSWLLGQLEINFGEFDILGFWEGFIVFSIRVSGVFVYRQV